MDSYISNIISIHENYHDEACILMITYLDELSNYTKFNGLYGNKNNKKKFLNFIAEYSGMDVYFNCIQMNKVYLLKDKCKNKIERTLYEKIYNKYKEFFDKFINNLENEGEVRLSDSLTIDDIKNINGIEANFNNCNEYEGFLGKISFGEKFYNYRCSCVHEHSNKFHGDFVDLPYYLYISCIDGGFFITIEIPFMFLYKVLIGCYQNVKIEFNKKMNLNCGFGIENIGEDSTEDSH